MLMRDPHKSTIEIHQHLARVYEDDIFHAPRIKRIRELIAECPASPVVELGCGTGDNCGPFHIERKVIGYDCSSTAIDECRRRFPRGEFHEADIEKLEPINSGVLVVSELLEHIETNVELCEKWMPLAEYSVISHPLDEPVESGLSAGEHLFSLSMDDHLKFFEVGKHEVLHTEEMQMGSLRLVISRGRRKR